MTVLGFVARGTVIGALVGAVAGLILGVIANPPTAWFATLEIGLPAAVAGALIGLVAGVVVMIRRHVRVERKPDSTPEPDSIQSG